MATAVQYERLTIRAALILGFTLICALWVAADYRFGVRLDDLRREADEIGQRYIRAQALLSDIRSQVLLGSVQARDALLDVDADTLKDYQADIYATYEAVDNAIAHYTPVLDNGIEREQVARLRTEIDAYRQLTIQSLALKANGQALNVPAILSEQITPRREAVLKISEELQSLNRIAYVRQQDAIGSIRETADRSRWQQLALALSVSFGIAVLITMYAGRLERRIRAQAASDAQNKFDLQRLSAQLVHAQEEERSKISRDLHDEVGQVLTAVKMELSMAERAHEQGTALPIVLDRIRTITDAAIQSVRNLSRLLRPALLDDLGLASALNRYLRDFGERCGIRPTLHTTGLEQRLPVQIETAAFRIVQESLTNIARHSHASVCEVRIERTESTLRMSVQDNGVGFAASDPASLTQGVGLLGMRERALALGGTVSIDSGPGQGTRIVAELPIPIRSLAETTVAETTVS